MARKYEVLVTGAGTSGAFELYCASQDGGPVWATGAIPVSAGPSRLVNALMPGMDAYAEMGTNPGITVEGDVLVAPHLYAADQLTGPKSWIVTLEGSLYAGIGRCSGGARLTGMCSPSLVIVDLGYVPDRDHGAGIETPETARPVN